MVCKTLKATLEDEDEKHSSNEEQRIEVNTGTIYCIKLQQCASKSATSVPHHAIPAMEWYLLEMILNNSVFAAQNAIEISTKSEIQER